MELVNRSYVDIPQVVRELGLGPVTGVLLDLGVSLHQLQESCRGFSHDRDGELDMRFDPRTGASAREVISRASEQQLREWLRNFGEEPMSGRIARVIHEARGRVRTTHDLVRLVRSVVPARLFRRSLPRVFQAFRIAVNAELEGVRAGLAAALEVLAPGGRAVVISYHSLEDRLAKQALRAAGDGVCVLTRKPVRPGVAEVERNPRARSARLRAAEVVA
jgi:16S rRNA (cytosine1402-N4)-methyltransferase